MQNSTNFNNQRIVIIDYGMGNLRSVLKKFIHLKINAILSSEPVEILKADKLILPGVGHFANGMRNLKDYGILDILNEKVLNQNTPILGICLGMQLFSKHSEEGNTEGLGWVDAKTIRFNISNNIKWKVPHIGWNTLSLKKDHSILKGINENDSFYFVHSYHLKCNETNDIITTTNYDYEFVSGIKKNNIYGFQFHPEKSQDCGSLLIENFVKSV